MRRRSKRLFRDRRRQRRKKWILGSILFLLVAVGLIGFALYQEREEKLGANALEEGKYQEAVTHFAKSIKEDGEKPELCRGLALAYYGLEEYEQAAEQFQKAQTLGTIEDTIFCQMLGSCYMKLEQYKEACEIYTKGLELTDGEAERRQEMSKNRIVACEKLGDWEQAKIYLEEHVKEFPEAEGAKEELDFINR